MISLLLAIIYISFISLGLPDALLGAAWPTMSVEFGVPISYAGVVSIIISLGTIVSSLLSDRLTRRFGPGKVTAVSVMMTAAALAGFAFSGNYWLLCLWAVPYGLGAGGVDAALNNYVALHYASRHMSWLHCMWGLGASTGPYIMGFALTRNLGWSGGYWIIAILQVILSGAIVASLPLWKKSANAESKEAASKPLSMKQIFTIPGAKEVVIAFFCYCGLEQTAGLWASSYLVLKDGLDPEYAASLASLFYIGITAGRAVSGFLTYKFDDTNMIRLGQVVLAAGVVVMLLPMGYMATMVGLIMMGLGCAPIYPSVIHSTPAHFGAQNSQALVGVQMASAYVGCLLLPPLFGLIAEHISAGWLPWYLAAILVVMVIMCEMLNKKTAGR